MNIQSSIGRTPLIELRSFDVPADVRIFAKAEFMNPGGSIKDRIVRYIIGDAERRGLLGPGATIVENTSGNTGAAIAMLAAARGYRAILTMPDKVSKEKQDALRAMGAEVVVCPASAPPGSPQHYVTRARSIHAGTPGSFMLDQYDNPLNAEAHFRSTGPEIWDALGPSVTAFVASGSTGGTISGTSRFLKSKNPSVTSVLLDPAGSIYHRYFHDGVVDPAQIAPYFVEGAGEDHLAQCMDFSVVDDVIRFTDADAFATCRHLAQREGLLCGGTSGANVWGAVQVARSLKQPATVVTVLPDSGNKYISKIYNPDWLARNGFGTGEIRTLEPTL
ncbi:MULTISPECIES: PLP-dependent cysteine synthase family protein [Streptomyces]|uniref:Cysteine synthase family protein n=2 Tax=Streptomyces TaxID=1883 RepID=A0A3R7FGQ9_9ACTN|nr:MULTISPECIES: cysteine synthase family protein [Streptomyces]KNE81220.1 cystathionine beta-synthase [Streptomyces fradiae]OFA46731.1 cystathionine beta-synthase [Streptomyces fradiae]PQM22296.1 cysteine synthase family protein [Streptomyces xinghaiensis]RKM96735.1 cysteine synthase family protein [Streptomyces xinghaiensis]RNC74113.1 cysteine synthase family protein [Streptomyces xinghaiensis]